MSTERIERRTLDVTLEFRVEGDSKRPMVRGYAAVFNTPSLVLGAMRRFRETLAPGAFRSALAKGASVPLLIEHDGLALADTATGSLTLAEDDKGLRFEAELDPSDPDAQRVIPKLQRGTLRKMSFGFTVAEGGADLQRGRDAGVFERTVRQIDDLMDVSLVTSPAYPATSAALRSLDAAAEEIERLEQQPVGTPALSLRKRKLLLLPK